MRLRSLLFVPGDRPERFDKAVASRADAIIFDLEDSVHPSAKAKARNAVSEYVASHERQGAKLFVRVNPLDSQEISLDLPVAAAADCIVLPKARGGHSIVELDALLGRSSAMILPIATETPDSVFGLGTYPGAPRLCGLTWGAEDLPAAIGATTSREDNGEFTEPYKIVRAFALFGAHAAGVPAIETVYPNIRDLDGLAAYAARGARDGFTGMMAIHPDQVTIINDAFSPSDQAIKSAATILKAFAAHPGAGVLEIDGQMIDAPHIRQARRTFALAGLPAPSAAEKAK